MNGGNEGTLVLIIGFLWALVMVFFGAWLRDVNARTRDLEEKTAQHDTDLAVIKSRLWIAKKDGE